MNLLQRLKQRLSRFRRSIGWGSLSYGILKPCYNCVYTKWYWFLKVCKRCTYGKSHEPILIYSFHRDVRCIVNYNGKTYTRRNKCLGFRNCGSCLEVIDGKLTDLPCKWIRI